MARVEYESRELDQNHQIIEGIRRTLDNSPRGRARTTLCAVNAIDLMDEAGGGSLDQKIAHVCQTLGCKHECVDDEIIFTI